MKILISDALSGQGIDILSKAGLSVDVKTKLTPEALVETIPEYEGLIIRSATKVTRDVIAAASRLKVIGRAGSGLDNVDLPVATARGIVVMNTPGGNTVTTAEHTVALMFAMARHVPQANSSIKAGKWEKNRFMGMEFFNKTLGIIGLGQIGGYIAKLAQGLSMTVIGYDVYLSKESAEKMGVERVDLDTLYSRADVVTVHTPLTPETRYLINAAAIGKMKTGVRIINCARGGIVNEKDLYEAMTSGKVAAAAFDVFEKEPVDPQHPLLSLENFICTPHLGAATQEAQENVAIAIAEQIVDFFVHDVVRYAVNLPSVPPDLMPKIRPYVSLAEAIGSFLGQILEGAIERVNIAYHGEACEMPSAPLSVAVLKGLLNPVLEGKVNMVSAPSIAKERGISVHEMHSNDAGNFPALIRVDVETARGAKHVLGAIFNRIEPRLVEVDGIALEVIPEGAMLYLNNEDKPGVIGHLGQLLAKHQVNIARMQLGRERPGGRAVSVVGIDAQVSAEILSEIQAIPHILSVHQVTL